jgi:hypothetical protein
MVLAMIGKCSECGRRRKLYYAVGSTINALWCAECISKHKDNIEKVYEIPELRLYSVNVFFEVEAYNEKEAKEKVAEMIKAPPELWTIDNAEEIQ